jgi:hypothetical protein
MFVGAHFFELGIRLKQFADCLHVASPVGVTHCGQVRVLILHRHPRIVEPGTNGKRKPQNKLVYRFQVYILATPDTPVKPQMLALHEVVSDYSGGHPP